MAIYSLNAKTFSRSSGASGGSRSDYINREKQYSHDAQEVLDKSSGNMPEWAQEQPRQYWDAADVYERANGRLFKQVMFALPNELNADQQKELVKEFVEKISNTKDGKLPYSYAIHKGHDSNNPHCHLMLSERVNDGHPRSRETWFKRANPKEPELGGSKKTTALMPKQWLLDTREQWSLQANKALELAGVEQRIDHRSLKDQGIDREPTKHRGVALNAMLKSGKIQENEVEKPLEPTANKEADLAEALRLKQAFAEGIAAARQEYIGEKDRQLADERARREQEHQRKLQEKLQREQEQAKLQIQKDLERDQRLNNNERQRQKSRGMGMSR